MPHVDKVYAGSGSTTVYGGVGIDEIYGGSGQIHFTQAMAASSVRRQKYLLAPAIQTVYGGAGIDEIHGGSGTDVLYAAAEIVR